MDFIDKHDKDVEIPVTQYLRPDGRKREMTVRVPRNIALIFRECHMVASAEVLTTDEIAVYIRRPEWDEDNGEELLEICVTGPTEGTKLSPPSGLSKLIKQAATMVEFVF